MPKIDKRHLKDGRWGGRERGGESYTWESLRLDPASGGRGSGEEDGEDNRSVTAEGWPSTEHPPPPPLNARMAHVTRVSEVTYAYVYIYINVCVFVCLCVCVCVFVYGF